MMRRVGSGALVWLIVSVSGCSGDGGEGGGGSAGSAGTGGSQSSGGAAGAGASGGAAGSGAGGSGGSAGSTVGGTSAGGTGGSVSGFASISGQIGRTARIPAGLDGVGTLYIAVFADNPVTNMNAEALANTLIEDADLSVDGTGIAYRVDDIPTSSSPRYIVAFMDDDGNADISGPAPAKPDLIAFDGLSPISVTLNAPGETELDLVLNAEMPF